MNKWLRLLKKGLILNRMFMIGWVSAFLVFNFMMYFLYPGEEGIQSFLGLLDQEIFQLILGEINSDAAPVLIWMSFALPTMGLITFIASSLYGTREILLDVDLGTHETFFPLPISRRSNLLISLINGQIVVTIFNLTLLSPWFFPIEGSRVELSILMNLFILNQMFFSMGFLLGMLFAILGGNLGRSQQFSLLFILIFYSMQLIFRTNEGLQDFEDILFISWYNPNTILFQDKLTDPELGYAIYTSIALILLNFWLYPRKEFEKDIAMVNVRPLFSRIVRVFAPVSAMFRYLDPRVAFSSLDRRVSEVENNTRQGGKKSKSATSGVFVFWAKLIRKRLPYTADFLFSEARVLTILFWVIVMFYPLQFFAYPGDEEAQAFIVGFTGGFVNLITLGYDLSTQPYTWWIVTQAIGVHWFFMFPLVLYWGKKLVSYDRDKKVGDLVGALPVNPSSIVAQRILAIFIELHILYAQMALYTYLSDQTFGYGAESSYHLAAIYGFVPLYLFLTILIALPIYFAKERGVTFSRLVGIVVLMWFIIPYMTQTSVGTFEAGIIGLYNPVKVIVEQNLTEAINQILIFFAGAIPSGLILIRMANRMPFIESY